MLGLVAAFFLTAECFMAGAAVDSHTASGRTAAVVMNSWPVQWADWFAFPTLAAVLAFVLAQGSTSARGLADYKLWLACNALVDRIDHDLKGRQFYGLAALSHEAKYTALAAAAARSAVEASVVQLRKIVESIRPDSSPELQAAARDIANQLGFRSLRVGVDACTDQDEFTHLVWLEYRPVSGDVDFDHPDLQIDATMVRLLLFSTDLELSKSSLDLALPRSGQSNRGTVHIRTKAAHPVLSVIITRPGSAYILQEYKITLRVTP